MTSAANFYVQVCRTIKTLVLEEVYSCNAPSIPPDSPPWLSY